MLAIKSRAWLLGLLAMLLVGSFATAAAEAQGPFWYHRAKGESGKGLKITGQEPEGVQGGGGPSTLAGSIGGQTIELESNQVQVKGIIYNNALQGQTKLTVIYIEPHVVNPANARGCRVKINEQNQVKIYGHLAWKWDGSETQRKEQPQQQQRPDWIFLPSELQQGATELPNLTFAAITTTAKGEGECNPLLQAQQAPVKGSVAAAIQPVNLGEWSNSQTQEILAGNQKQHFWNGVENVGVETKLTLSGGAATLTGKTKVETTGRQSVAPQEVALFES